MNKNINILNQDSYLYELYNEYLNKVQFYQINGKINSLSLRYYKINYSISNGIEDELDMVNSKKFGKTYDIFDFTPVLENQPFTYNMSNDETNQGVIRSTQGMMTIMSVEEPLPNDVFHFYSNESEIEYLQVTNVNYVMSVKKLHIYQIEYITANLVKNTVDNFKINQHFYFLREFGKFIGSSMYNDIVNLSNTRDDDIVIINKYYDSRNCKYKSIIIDDDSNIIINKMLQIISENIYIPDIHPILVVDSNLDYTKKLVIEQSIIDMNDELVSKVLNMYNIYYKLLNYNISINDPSIATAPIKNTTVKDYKITTVKDLNGNIIKG